MYYFFFTSYNPPPSVLSCPVLSVFRFMLFFPLLHYSSFPILILISRLGLDVQYQAQYIHGMHVYLPT